MARSVLAVLSFAALGATGTCPQSSTNKAPAAPTFELSAIGATTLGGIVSSCYDPDAKPKPCTQSAAAFRPGIALPVAKVPVVGGIFTITGLTKGTDYEVQVSSYDGMYEKWGKTRGRFKTVSDTGPVLLGVAPTEIVVPGEAYLEGIAMEDATSAALIDARTGVRTALATTYVSPNRVRVTVPKPADLDARHRYFIQWGVGRKSRVPNDAVFLSPGAGFLPAMQKIRVHLIRWRWVVSCPLASPGIVGPPYDCACQNTNRWQTGTRASYDDPWPDTWTTTPFWTRFKPHFDDASREWGAMCSETRGSGTFRLGGLTEVERRVTLPGGDFAWPDVADYVVMQRLATRKETQPDQRCTPSGCEFYIPDYCEEKETGSYVDSVWIPPSQYQVPDDCWLWYPNNNSRINVHLALALYEDGEEVNPATAFRGISNPQGFRGMVILSDNRLRGSRRQWNYTYPGTEVFNPSLCRDDHPEWWNDGSAYNSVYWWGPPEGREAESVLGLLAHELVHVVLGVVHYGADPCDSPLVGSPTAACPRGFDLTYGDPNGSVEAECAVAINGISGHDYTR